MLKAFDTLSISLLYFSQFIGKLYSAIFIRHLNFLEFGIFWSASAESVGECEKKNQKLYFIIHKNGLLKEKSPKMFPGHSIFNTRLCSSKVVPSRISNYSTERKICFKSNSVCVSTACVSTDN